MIVIKKNKFHLFYHNPVILQLWGTFLVQRALSIDFQKKEEGFLDEYWVELCSEKLNPRDLTFFLG